MTVAAAVAAAAPARPEGKHGSYVDVDEGYHRRETIAAVTAAAAACHRRETSVAAAAAAAAACHGRDTSVAAAASAAAACHRRETSVAAAAAAEACHRREVPYRRPFVGLRLQRPPRPENPADKTMRSRGPPANTTPAPVSQFREPCVGSRRNGWCILVSSGQPESLFS